MKKITRLICLVLCLASLLTCMCFAGCSNSKTGAYINMYLSSEVYNFDPAYAHLDTSAMKLLPLIYEGLMKTDDDGKVVKALCKEWKYKEDKGVDTSNTPEGALDDKYTMTITLKTTAWSDGVPVSADDFVFAWKRLLEPDFDGEGAELLFDIKGAIERKTLAKSPDDIGLYADKQILTIEFAHPIDPDEFLRKLTSVALVPLRESSVTYYKDWSSASTTILTNGAYTIRNYDPGQRLILERNTYYRHDVSEDEEPNPGKHVKPFRIVVDYTLSGSELMKKYDDGELFFLSELPADTELRKSYESKVKTTEAYSSFVCYFNTNKAPFDNPAVRKALSDVINRDEIANAVVFAKASTGFVPSAVTDLSKKDSFADKNENPLSPVGKSVSTILDALNAAGVDPKKCDKFYLTVRANTDSKADEDGGVTSILNKNTDKMSNSVDVMVAQMIVNSWKELGFDCELKLVNTKRYKETTSELVQYTDELRNAIYGVDHETMEGDISVPKADFDVIAVDSQMLDTTAFSALSVFAKKYSGCQLDFENADSLYQAFGHFTGYDSEVYNKLIDEAYAAYVDGNKKLCSEKLHEAEKVLLEDMPVIPVFEYKNIVIKSSKLSKIGYSSWGSFDFRKTKLKDWKEYVPAEEETTTP